MTYAPREGRPSILIVEDDAVSQTLLARILAEAGYRASAASNAAEARPYLEDQPFDAALIDYRMPGESGIDLLKHIRSHYPDTAAIMVTAHDDPAAVELAFEIGAYGYVVKPYRVNELLINVSNALHRRRLQMQVNAYVRELEHKVLERTQRLRETLDPLAWSEPGITPEEVIERLSGAISLRDEETGVHIRRVSTYAARLANRVGLMIPTHQVRLASAMHDVGKIGVPDAILLKPGRLTVEEHTAMQRHTVIGHQLLSTSSSPLLQMSAVVALRHHERWDGTGYPAGLAGEEIPELGRVTAIADVFDALTSDRVYRPAMTVDEAVAIMSGGRGSHFAPDYLDAFLDDLDTILELREAAS